ncbi:hypothetical protein AAFF_G00021820 [Aldrovandia affinis]|uniref:Uncharacterized protein n=1 Tax=Aldrovandia affinis TaxID=143900 RepID=A0AAD7S509_9TELE|nr:hypothetical protein AAFF_G00021820 [Aldrovandia affinis]
MREVDSMSRMRRLSARSSDSGGEEAEDGGAYRSLPQPEPQDRRLSLPLSLPLTLPTHHEPRNSTVAKREITLPLGFCGPSNRTLLQDEGTLSLSDHYDPSRVERV